ncbi:4'-phosphopantetheinyl transferase family protein [Nisaea nitritireducens]|uniref:4'-phosphopantetheinyl transferase family protein n=1 Tax=Nisaea nitritireducens TaxID=568392 RepID=UPI00186725EB|nr:4'-phosphopantetheinyl transferase superfamily protein [Nisaea nitritireducens]
MDVSPACLDDEERDQASRFITAELSRRFTAGRVMRRMVLSKYTGLAPHALRFGEIGQKKPILLGLQSPLEFNQTNSGDLALLAVSSDMPVGIDLEVPKDRSAALDIAKHQFHELEKTAIFSRCTENEQVAAFYRCWTRKEAFVKALGLGLYLPLNSFAVDVNGQERTKLLVCPDEHGPPAMWEILDLGVPGGNFAALAIAQPQARLQCFSYAFERC